MLAIGFLGEGDNVVAVVFALLSVGIALVYAAITGPWFDSLEDYIEGEALLSDRPSMVVRAQVMGRYGIGSTVAGYDGFGTALMFGTSAMVAFAGVDVVLEGYLPGLFLLFLAAALFGLGLVLRRLNRAVRPQVLLIRRAGRQVARRSELIDEALSLAHPDRVRPTRHPVNTAPPDPPSHTRFGDDSGRRAASPVMRFIAWMMMLIGGIGLLITLTVFATAYQELFGSITDSLELVFMVPIAVGPVAIFGGLMLGGRKLLIRRDNAVS